MPASIGGKNCSICRKTAETRLDEKQAREARVRAWVDSGGTDAHWMLATATTSDERNKSVARE
eukprot:SAG31_NODE_1106_length_9878_cov_4.621331_16_plen_63_part_00